MKLKERAFEARAAYLEGYRAGEDNMQLQVLRILQKIQVSIIQSQGRRDILLPLEEQVIDIKEKVLNIPLLSCLTNPDERDKRG